MDVGLRIKELRELKGQDGITLSGGDPFMQPKAVNEIAKYVKSIDKNVWAYTGFEFEQLLEMSEKNNSIKELLNNIDVLIDGKFKIEELSLDLYYRGSRNQRVINVKESLKQNQVILIEKFMKDKQIKNLVEKKKYVFV